MFISELISGFHPVNERWRYFVTMSLIGWVRAQNQPCDEFRGISFDENITTFRALHIYVLYGTSNILLRFDWLQFPACQVR